MCIVRRNETATMQYRTSAEIGKKKKKKKRNAKSRVKRTRNETKSEITAI